MSDQMIDTIKKTIGKRIRAHREASGLSLRDLGAITNTGHSWLAKLEKGQINFGIESLAKLLKNLQIQPEELFKFNLPYSDD
jgi:transcriptional regulator with XRE-family HTH domain